MGQRKILYAMYCLKTYLSTLGFFFFCLFSLAQQPPHCNGGNWSWLQKITSTGADAVTGITTDDAGYVYITGDFASTLTLFGTNGGKSTLIWRGGFDAFVAKYDPNGNIVWAQGLGGNLDERCRAIHYYNGKLYVAGSAESQNVSYANKTIITDASSGNSDGILLQVNANTGNLLWSTTISSDRKQNSTSSGHNQGIYDIDTDELGDVYIAGVSSSAFESIFQTRFVTGNCFSAKYSQQRGTCLWANGWGNSKTGNASFGLKVYNGVVYTTGIFTGQVQVSTGALVTGMTDIFVAKQNTTNGMITDFSSMGTNSPEPASGSEITTTKEGTIVLTGGFTGTTDFNPQTAVSRGQRDIFIAEYNSQGQLLFLKSIGSTSADYGTGITIDKDNNLYITGVVGASLDFDGTPLTITGSGQLFVAKYRRNATSSTSADRWVLDWVLTNDKANASNMYSAGSDIVSSPSGSILLGGTFSNDLSIGPNTLITNTIQEQDGFVSEIKPGSMPTVQMDNLVQRLCPNTPLRVSWSVQCPPAVSQTYVIYGTVFSSGLPMIYELGRVSGTTATYASNVNLSSLYSSGTVAVSISVRNNTTRISSAGTRVFLSTDYCLIAPPICETTQPQGGEFVINSSGVMEYKLGTCSTGQLFSCLSSGVVAQNRVVATSATILAHDWSPEGYTGTNPYEDGLAGRWRAQRTFAYNTTLAEDTRNFSAGTFTATPFNWNGGNPQTWVPATTVLRYSVNGEATEEQDVLGNYSCAKFGYAGSVPYLVAQNARYEETLFESFESAYPILAPARFEDNVAVPSGWPANIAAEKAHSGKKCLLITGSFATRPFPVSDRLSSRGLWVKVWIRSGNGLTKDLAGMQQVAQLLQFQLGSFTAPMRVVAQTGEWSLCETLIAPAQLPVTPVGSQAAIPTLVYTGTEPLFIDDLRIQPADAQMICYVYDENLRPIATFDDQHFGVYSQYNSEGKLIRKLIETQRGIKMVQETQYNMPKVDQPQN